MRLLESEKRVVDAARETVTRLGSDPNHTVAAAAMDVYGNVYTGINVSHFTGGPCAELVVLGAAAGAGPLMTMVAVGDRGRDVIAPCGRCRQTLLDLHPDVVVIVPGSAGLEAQSIRALLPFAYRYPDATAARLVRFARGYRDDIRSGLKTATVRWNDPVAIGPALLVFEDDAENVPLAAMIESVESRRFDELTDADARRENAESAADLRAGLRSHYPELTDESIVEVVGFRLVEAAG